nr:HAMP domain-containing sensor histidine kinase [Chryseosolibacter indicus]
MEKFLYSTSHDLRSPLTSIFGLVNLARLESKEPVIQDYFSRIESSAMRLDNLIRDIISFSKTTYQTVKYDKVDVRSLIEKYLNSYKDNASFGTIEFEIITQCNEAVFSDPERLGVILDNLIRNAIHFFDPNKATSFVRISAASSKENVTIEIMDNGVGIPSQHLEKVFDMFYKASIHSKGAGLGLYIVKETVNTLNGNVSVESELGFGTIFRLVIPNKA